MAQGKRMHGKRLSLIVTLLILAALVGGLGWMIYAPIRQQRLNHALIAAIRQNDTQKALSLLAAGADPDSRDEPAQHLSLWRLLLNKLQGKHPTPSKAPTALLMSIVPVSFNDHHWYYPTNNPAPIKVLEDTPNPSLIKALLDRGADVNASDEDGNTPLHLVIDPTGTRIITNRGLRRRDLTIKLLLEHGANVNASNKDGDTPFIMSIGMENHLNADIFEAVLNRGANVNEKSSDGETPLKMAKERGDRQIIQMLKQAGAKE